MIDIARLRRLLEEGTPEPWELDPEDMIWGAGELISSDASGPDAALIVAMHEALPQLLDEIERLREGLQDALEDHPDCALVDRLRPLLGKP